MIPILYLDIYFLINFTVDYLSLYFSSLLINVKTSIIRILLLSFFGGALPCALILFCINEAFYIPIYLAWLVITSVVLPINATFLTSLKVVCAFSLIQTLFGGAVTMFYEKLEYYLIPLLGNGVVVEENSKVILFSAVIALVYCFLKILRLVLCASVDKRTATVTLKIFETSFSLVGLIDSGCFLKDPMDLSPVIIIKEGILKKNVNFLNSYPITDGKNPLSKRLRIIPYKTLSENKILYGFKPDSLTITFGKNTVSINSTVAIDTEQNSFNDCDALIPLSAIT